MTRNDVLEAVQNWSSEKTDICADLSLDFTKYYCKLLDIIDDTFNENLEDTNSNVTFLAILGGLIDATIIGITEKDARYYALIAAIYECIHTYQN